MNNKDTLAPQDQQSLMSVDSNYKKMSRRIWFASSIAATLALLTAPIQALRSPVDAASSTNTSQMLQQPGCNSPAECSPLPQYPGDPGRVTTGNNPNAPGVRYAPVRDLGPNGNDDPTVDYYLGWSADATAKLVPLSKLINLCIGGSLSGVKLTEKCESVPRKKGTTWYTIGDEIDTVLIGKTEPGDTIHTQAKITVTCPGKVFGTCTTEVKDVGVVPQNLHPDLPSDFQDGSYLP